jgi:exopolysaccharide production protein ExoY
MSQYRESIDLIFRMYSATSEGATLFDREAIVYSRSGPDAVDTISINPRRCYLLKRVLDVVITIVISPFALFVVGVVAPLVCMDGGKIFLRQPRIGKDGKLFNLWKIRTMQHDAQQRLQKYLDDNPVAWQEWESHQKLRDDPRVTTIGRYLRKYSIDELPQLLNVLRGEMSLVGPRPMLPEQRAQYAGTAYFSLRPGLTGLWQIGDRNACSFAERAAYDERYLDIMSIATDIRILLTTPLVIFRGTGV